MHKKNGSVVIFSLLILSLMVALTQQLLYSVYVSSNFIKMMVDREKAEMLALSGITIAINKLLYEEEGDDVEDKGSEESKKPEVNKDSSDKSSPSSTDKKPNEKKFLKRILPYLNRWFSFELNRDQTGIDGVLKICIVCEDGKININKAFDFKKQDFRQEYAMLLEPLKIPGKMEEGELYSKIVEYLKNRKKPLYDVSELYDIEGFSCLEIFYTPPKPPKNEKEKPEENKVIALQDLFTTWSENDMLEPMMLSDSLCTILGLRRPVYGDADSMQDKFEELIKNYSSSWSTNWKENWKYLEPIYDGKPQLFENIGGIFKKEFNPKVYSVLLSGKVGSIEQRLLAIIRKTEHTKKKENEKNGSVSSNKQNKKNLEDKYTFKIERTYWL